MPQIRAGMTAANRAGARFVQRAIVSRPLGIFDVQLAAGRECLTRAPVAGWQDAVKHVHAARDRLDEVFRRPDTH